MSAITWLAAYPPDSSGASQGDDIIRSLKTTFAAGLGTSFYGPGSAASQGASTSSTGQMLPGTFRCRQALSWTAGLPDGYIGAGHRDPNLLVGRASLWHIGATVHLLGHSSALEHATDPGTAPVAYHWSVQSGSSVVAVGAGEPQDTLTASVVYPTAYAGVPFTHASLTGSGSNQYLVALTTRSATGFTSVISRLKAAGVASVTLQWFSEGTVAT